MDEKKQLNVAINTGNVAIGSNKTIKSLLYENPKLTLLSSNCPKQKKETITYYSKIADIPCITLKENSIEVGSSCGRPHPISAVSIIDEGESNILEVQQ